VASIKESGTSCVFISHDTYHVYPMADRIIILGRGEIVDTFVKGQIGIEQLETRLLQIAGTSEVDLKVPTSSRAVARE
jgi:simple sugar transport system ATP-binding protein